MATKIILPLVVWVGVVICLGWFFSYRLLQTPLGLTADEGGFGINATLLSRTGHDENGKFLPVFVLSLNGTDWRQPVTQYYLTLLFKIFGPSVYLLRFPSVIITLLSTGLVYFLVKRIMNSGWAIFAVFVFVTTPLIMIQSHMGLDNIMPIPFTLIWLICLYLWDTNSKPKYLLWAGIGLGVAFYSYKGMRAIIPVWALLTAIYLARDNIQKTLRNVWWFGLGIGPFLLAAPVLERIYPGAVFDGQGFKWDSWYTFLYPYFSSFDLSFLFISGDATPWHSTGKHGMLLLASLPLFVLGIWESVKRKGFMAFSLAAFFTTPLLFGFVESVHRASRLMAIIPIYTLICVAGASWLWVKNKTILVVLVGMMVLNYADFTYFYWYKFPELTRQWFGDLSEYQDYQTLGNKSMELGLTPYLDSGAISSNNVNTQFFSLAYLGQIPSFIGDNDPLPTDGILLTKRGQINGLNRLDEPMVRFYLQVHPL